MEFAGHTAAFIGIKLVVLFPLALAFGYSRGDSVRITFLLAQSGEFGFVLLGSALVLSAIDEATFIMAVAVISLSMLMTPLLVRVGDRLSNRLEGGRAAAETASTELPDESERPVLIGGYGRMGHTIAMLLQASGVPFVAFDTDPKRVQEGRANGQTVLYGDISDPELLAATHAERASLVVLTIDHGATTLRAVSHLRNTCPRVQIIARARDLEACTHLLRAGATQAFPEAIEASRV